MRTDEDARGLAAVVFPTLGHGLIETAAFVVDRIVLGHHSAAALAALHQGSAVVWFVEAVAAAGTIGATAVVAREYGRNDEVAARTAARTALVAGLVWSVFVALVLGPLLLAFMNANADPGGDPTLQRESERFALILLYATPLHATSWMCGAILRATGAPRVPLWIGLGANVLNALLAPTLVFGWFGAPSLGALGAGLATASAWSLECVSLLVVLALRKRYGLRGAIDRTRAALSRIVSVTWPVALERASQHIGFFGIGVLVGQLGPDQMAAHQTILAIESVCFYAGEAVGTSTGAVVAQHLGADAVPRAERVVRIALVSAVAFFFAVAVVFLTNGRHLLGWVTESHAAIAVALVVMPIVALMQPAMASAYVFGEVLRAAGQTRATLMVSLGTATVLRLSLALVLTPMFGFAGVWIAIAADWFVRATAFAVIFRRGRWKR